MGAQTQKLGKNVKISGRSIINRGRKEGREERKKAYKQGKWEGNEYSVAGQEKDASSWPCLWIREEEKVAGNNNKAAKMLLVFMIFAFLYDFRYYSL